VRPRLVLCGTVAALVLFGPLLASCASAHQSSASTSSSAAGHLAQQRASELAKLPPICAYAITHPRDYGPRSNHSILCAAADPIQTQPAP
jgi:hypothetical protein